MASLTVIKVQAVFQGQNLVLLARVERRSGNSEVPVQIADVSTISYAVFNGSTQIGAVGTFVAASVIHNSLQTGEIWTVDDTGFNFDAPLAKEYLPTGGNDQYSVNITLTLTGGSVCRWAYLIPVLTFQPGV